MSSDKRSYLYDHVLRRSSNVFLQLLTFEVEFLKPLLLQHSYGPLDQKFKDVKTASEQVESVIQMSDRKKLAKIDLGVEGVQKDITELKNLFLKFIRAQFQTAKCSFLISYGDDIGKYLS